jgi:hypothetical protein
MMVFGLGLDLGLDLGLEFSLRFYYAAAAVLGIKPPGQKCCLGINPELT